MLQHVKKNKILGLKSKCYKICDFLYFLDNIVKYIEVAIYFLHLWTFKTPNSRRVIGHKGNVQWCKVYKGLFVNIQKC